MDKDDFAIRDAFAKIKKDIEGHSNTLSEFDSKSKKIERFMLDIKKELSELRQSIDIIDKKNREYREIKENKESKETPALKQIDPEIDEIRKSLGILTRDQEIYSQLRNDVELLKKELLLKNSSYKSEIKKTIKDVFQEIKKPTLKTEIMQRFDRNKKRILTQKILDIVSERQLTLSELKTLVVDELRYCSKASFYRYFEHIKRRKMIDFVEYDGVDVLVLVRGKSEPK